MQATAVRKSASNHVIELDESEFRQKFNRQWFPLTHALSDSPLFELDRLIELAQQTAQTRPDDLYFDKGAKRVGQRWSETPTCDLPVDETIRRIEKEGAWIILKHAERDPDYQSILQAAMRDILELTGRELECQIKYSEVILFVTSPGRLTTYHIDRECNFVAQIRGNKTIYLFDPKDREVLPEEEIERFWAVDNNAGTYKEHLQHRADSFLLEAGNGVHIPVNGPHWLQNHDDVSITASLNFKFKDGLLANVYRANYTLRKMGLNPLPPGSNPVRDAVKSGVVGAFRAISAATPDGVRDALKRKLR